MEQQKVEQEFVMGVLKPDLIIKSIIPVMMNGILGIYGLIVAVIL